MKQRPKKLPVALTIAGSDSGGGAGIQADLKTFTALGVLGTSAITCITAQNPRRVKGVEACSPNILKQQIEAVFETLRPAAVKTGMLCSASLVRMVSRYFSQAGCPPLVVDPVMVSTSGAALLDPAGIRALVAELLPRAIIATPNLHEAEILLNRRLHSVEDLRSAAKMLHERFGCAALVKGGHLRGLKVAADIFYDGRVELLLSAPFVRGVKMHGTGCTFSAAITAYLARGYTLSRAVIQGKDYITHAISRRFKAGGFDVLNHWAFP